MPSLPTASFDIARPPLWLIFLAGFFLPVGFFVLVCDGRGVGGAGPSMLIAVRAGASGVDRCSFFLFRGLSHLHRLLYYLPFVCLFFANVSSAVVCFFALLWRRFRQKRDLALGDDSMPECVFGTHAISLRWFSRYFCWGDAAVIRFLVFRGLSRVA